MSMKQELRGGKIYWKGNYQNKKKATRTGQKVNTKKQNILFLKVSTKGKIFLSPLKMNDDDTAFTCKPRC